MTCDIKISMSWHLYYLYSTACKASHNIIQYGILYINHGGRRFGSFWQQNKITQKPVSLYHPGALAVLVRYNQAQKCLQCNPKYLLQNLKKNFFNGIFYCLPACPPTRLRLCSFIVPKCARNSVRPNTVLLIKYFTLLQSYYRQLVLYVLCIFKTPKPLDTKKQF